MTDAIQLYNQPVVFDNGSAVIKAGFCGEERPKCLEYSMVGDATHTKATSGGLAHDTYVGNKAQNLRGLLRLRYAVERGVVSSWDDMELIWSHVLYDSLQLENRNEHPLLMTEAPLNPHSNREKIYEVLFEKFNFPAICVSLPAVLSLYASGSTTGCVLDCGDGYCSSVSIYKGYTLSSTIRRTNLGGRDITEQLQYHIRSESGPWLFSSSEREMVRIMKEKGCYISPDPRKEAEDYQFGSDQLSKKFKLPDGKVLALKESQFRAPEILFRPDITGIEEDGLPEMVLHSISNVDLELRPELLSKIVLSGGSTMFPGFGQRMLKELQGLTHKKANIRLIAPPERKYSAWIGGSVLASLTTFNRMLTTQSDWQDNGSKILFDYQ
ncbi:hypothetical protein HG536_0D02800 [Torulaspora globosa]|uniref:Centractin n=1 Tax=Torulaspora globosa TaxID=48254 RepID=A0A7G3ZGX2_9SACH|nr:uncharacterized protein HG536_0D02800 [Torulaspora globosa]QLL32758.1 hypothetical protein HG536_0D02800 [Torulaspora globosa]